MFKPLVESTKMKTLLFIANMKTRSRTESKSTKNNFKVLEMHKVALEMSTSIRIIVQLLKTDKLEKGSPLQR